MPQLQVDLGDRSYPIYIGENMLGNENYLAKHIHGKQVLIVTNPTIANIYLDQVTSSLDNFHVQTHLIEDGEKYKTLASLESIFTRLLELQFDRKCTLIALGGGVVGDITGFAAAAYVRGVDFIQIPTTLLAQVDSSVGGKTAVNHPLGKNMIGAFHQPNCVIADTTTLTTLPKREVAAGMAEVIKYGLIDDLAFFEWLEQNADALMTGEPQALAYAIERSCQNKANIVTLDEREGGARALLNLGHTFGHAIEAGHGYGEWLHGEAVAAGMVMAADMSMRRGKLTTDDCERIKSLLTACSLPIAPPENLSAAEFYQLMMRDKKVQDGALRLVLNASLGKSEIISDFTESELKAVIADFLG